MAGTTADAETATARLDAALERIAQLAARPTAPTPRVAEAKDRLDRVIERLRATLHDNS